MHHTSGLRAKVNGGLRLLGAALNRPIVGPRMVGLEITHFCNLKCGFCESHGHLMPAPIIQRRSYAGDRKSMDLDTIQRLARSLAKSGVPWVELSGKGDPVVHPKLPEIIRILKAEGLRCSMFTTGSIPRPDLAATLVECGLDRLNVSLNAATRETWAKVAGKDMFDKALGFLKEVLELKRRRGSKEPWVRVSFVVCKDNWQDMALSVELLKELGVNEGGWSVMGEMPENVSLQLDTEQAAELRAAIPGWKSTLAAAGVGHDLDSFAKDLELRIRASGQQGPQENPLQKELPCYEGWMHAVIGPDGAVAPCCYCENVNLGNVVETDFETVWKGEKYAEFRNRSLAMPKTQDAICRECYTSCNKVHENRRTHERLHQLGLAR
jgi:radical SAM protein with 4Fe4S-binding SPASM domain